MSAAKIVQHTQKIFVRNLPWTVGNRQLKEYFSAFGHVSSAHVVVDANIGLSRGFGFVHFSLKEGYDAVLKQKMHTLDGRVISIEEATAP